MFRIFLSLIIVVFCFSVYLHCEDLHQIFHYHGETHSSGIGFTLKALGDINNDGFDDIAFSSGDPKGIYIFFGGNPVDSTPDYFLPNAEILGDFLDYDGDGEPELVASWDSALYFYQTVDGILDTIPSDSLVIPSGKVQYTLMETGYLNNDSIADLTIRLDDPYEGEGVYLYYGPIFSDTIYDWSFEVIDYKHQLTSAGFIDYNGDSLMDIFLSRYALLDTSSYIDIYFGPAISGSPDLIIAPPIEFELDDKDGFAYFVSNIGDINGDSCDDLGVASPFGGTHALIYTGGSMVDTIYDYWLDGGCVRMSKAGDVNADGYNDVIIGGANAADGSVILYYGGPDIDTIRDGYITRGDLPPLFLDNVGKNLTSAGDFNKDGFYDILFKCDNFSGSPGDVFIHSGGDDVLPVEDFEDIRLLPETYNLYQNYPNPFNPSTTIEFELTTKSFVELTVYNVLGRKVKNLISEELPVGSHSIQWNGVDENGDGVASGIYFYKINTGQFSDTKKMVLMK